MDLKLIRNLVRLMERGEVTELEIDDEKAGMRIHLKRGTGPEGGGGASLVMVPGAAAHGPPPAYQQVPRNIDDDEGAGLPAGTLEITSPMVGTFYRSSAPDADPFVDVGVRIEEEDVICIIEAMKVMNEIKAEFGGEIVEILVENGEPVEFGQPLFLVQTR